MKFIMLINAKMPTIIGILIFISLINTTFENSAASDLVVLSLSWLEWANTCPLIIVGLYTIPHGQPQMQICTGHLLWS